MSTSFLARHYNTMTGFPGRITNLAGMIEPWVKEWNVKSALDAGCGGGALMFALDQLGVDVVGLDINEAMLRLALDNAREAGKTFRFSGAPFSSAAEIFPERFDAAFVIGNALVSHETEAEMMVSLRGLHDSIKPGGHILIQNLNFAPFALGLKTVINKRVVDDLRFLRFAIPAGPGRLFFTAIAEGPGDEIDITTHNWTIWDRERLSACLDRTGFTGISVYGGINRSPYELRTSTDLVFSAQRH